MHFVDTHCHIHDPEFTSKYKITVKQQIEDAKKAGVGMFICVGTDFESSKKAVEFVTEHKDAYSSIAIHPHEAEKLLTTELGVEFTKLETLIGSNKLVAIGECGLDYYYHESQEVRDKQKALFKLHLDLAIKHNLPLIFHIRSAFDDFFSILDEYYSQGKKITGVVHSFSAHEKELIGCLERGLFIGLNGIMTFTKVQDQLDAAKLVPLDKMVLETDAPFLTPRPFRGNMCELKHVVVTAQFLSELRGDSLETIAAHTTNNAKTLFGL